MKLYIFWRANQRSKVNYLDGVRTFYGIRVVKCSERIANLNCNLKLFKNFTLQPFDDVFAEINMTTRNFIHTREELLGFSPLRQEYFCHSVEVVVNQRARSYNLLSVRRGFTVVGYFGHTKN